MTPTTLIYVALGGAIGAVGRFAVVSAVGGWMHGMGSQFPLGTLVVNIMGSFALGVLVEISALVWSPSPEIRSLLVVGMLGAFTTFSTFSLDVVAMLSRGQMGQAALYMGLSVALSVLALYMGMQIIKAVLS